MLIIWIVPIAGVAKELDLVAHEIDTFTGWQVKLYRLLEDPGPDLIH
jgi:hypothetical protein